MSPHLVKSSAKEALKKRTWVLGDKFDSRMPHHDGIQALWETKWKSACMKSVYPFHDGKFEDFEPVFRYLIFNNVNDGYGDEYTGAFFPAAENLTARGILASGSGDHEKASELYLRAACLYRISRFPYVGNFPQLSSESKWKAWEAQKAVYMRAASSWGEPMRQVMVPHIAAEDADRDTIPVYVRLPKSAIEGKHKAPAVILITGLDGYRPDNTQRSNEFTARGWASVIVEIPGTADCPSDPSDPKSPERLWTSLLDWMVQDGRFDMRKIMVWGLSAGGYYAVRIAHTHKDKLAGSVAQGAGTHFFFDMDWIEKADNHEYPFSLWPAMALKHGYTTATEFKNDAQKRFSLLENGILQQPSTRLLLINGTDDGLMPIEDSMLLFEHGTPKEARFFANALHMGYPLANSAVYPWMEQVMRT
ncbi:pigment biosynthesis protein-like protein yellowish-green 1 [Bisporella sp. PMI_857]|nr:pigment biosynthesis protein-like protein yellowish-green 1 [Bisporella sp. PMI_857]